MFTTDISLSSTASRIFREAIERVGKRTTRTLAQTHELQLEDLHPRAVFAPGAVLCFFLCRRLDESLAIFGTSCETAMP